MVGGDGTGSHAGCWRTRREPNKEFLSTVTCDGLCVCMNEKAVKDAAGRLMTTPS